MDQGTLTTLSVAAPAYNEARSLEETVREWHGYLQGVDGLADFEIVICNDGSRDDTGDILKRLAHQYPAVKGIHHRHNRGAAAALATAIRQTRHDWVLLLDGDGQIPINSLDRFRRALQEHPAPAFIGIRPRKADSGFARFGSWASGWVCNMLYGTRYKDFNSACKLVDGKVLRWLPLEAKGLNYSTDITAKLVEAGFPPVEVPVAHAARQAGKSSRTVFKSSLQRLLFVSYLGFRQFLIFCKVLQKLSERTDRPYA